MSFTKLGFIYKNSFTAIYKESFISISKKVHTEREERLVLDAQSFAFQIQHFRLALDAQFLSPSKYSFFIRFKLWEEKITVEVQSFDPLRSYPI